MDLSRARRKPLSRTIRTGRPWTGAGWSGSVRGRAGRAHLVGMDAPHSADPPPLDRLLTIEELSDYLGIPVPTLRDWRVGGRGPRAVKLGRALRYPQRRHQPRTHPRQPHRQGPGVLARVRTRCLHRPRDGGVRAPPRRRGAVTCSRTRLDVSQGSSPSMTSWASTFRGVTTAGRHSGDLDVLPGLSTRGRIALERPHGERTWTVHRIKIQKHRPYSLTPPTGLLCLDRSVGI